MTSSLVGSEMCIRDSFLGAHNKRFPIKDNPFAQLFLVQSELNAHAQATVSYTHLTLPTICSV
eukprot:8631023-Prorocentrum_lima.AAC.1